MREIITDLSVTLMQFDYKITECKKSAWGIKGRVMLFDGIKKGESERRMKKNEIKFCIFSHKIEKSIKTRRRQK